MNGDDDFDDVLHRLIDDDHAERILSGRVLDDDPVDNQALARLFAEVRSDPQVRSGDGDRVNPAFVARLASVAGTAHANSPSRRKPVITKLVRGKLAILAGAALLTTGVAAAASMPEASNRAAVAVPASPDTPRPHATESTETTEVETTEVEATDVETTDVETTEVETTAVETTVPSTESTEAEKADTPVGPDANGPAKHGLCTAYQARSQGNHEAEDQDEADVEASADVEVEGEDTPVAFANLEAAAAAAGVSVEDFCAPALAPKGQSTQAVERGRSAEHRALNQGKQGEQGNDDHQGDQQDEEDASANRGNSAENASANRGQQGDDEQAESARPARP